MIRMKRLPFILLYLTILLLVISGLQAQTTDSSSSGSETPGGWPRSFTNNGTAFTVYQPQATEWYSGVLSFKEAVSVLPQGAAQPIFGTVKLAALTAVDSVNQIVSLSEVSIEKSVFPSAPDQALDYATQLAGMAQQWGQQIHLGAITASLAVSAAQSKHAKSVPVQNTPPTIFFSQSPALLVLVDGQPALRSVTGTSLMRVINTQALIALDQTSGLYYLRVNGGWMQSSKITGPWTIAGNPSPDLTSLLQQAQGDAQVQLYDAPQAQKPPAPTPIIFVSTTPAELITTQGPPAFEPISGTQLLHASNTGSSLFMDLATQNYFVVISGRWFTAKSLTDSWQFVPANQLPSDFANIPENAPAGTVLASVAGTPQAQEATISATIPQTATISRSATLSVHYAGAPQFVKIPGTSLFYAPNTATPVIKLTGGKYYAVDNAVWFTAPSPTGPWSVADALPPVIYTIPPSSPIYYATSVYVYHSTPDVVTVGYTPGYYGSCIAPEGVVVYGTGYAYTPYINEGVWIGPPLTYGFGAGFACGLATGFAFGLAVDHGWGCSPWWGPWHGGWESWNGSGWNSSNNNWNKNSGNSFNRTVTNNWNNVNVNRQNAYSHWGNNVVKNNNISQSQINNAKTTGKNDYNQAKSNYTENHPDSDDHPNQPAPNRGDLQHDSSHLGNNTVFAGDDDHSYRSKPDGGWQKQEGSDWKDADPSHMDQSTRSDLNNQRYARNLGSTRSDSGDFSRGGGGGGFRR
jgi:hypothetical protein